MKTKPNYYICGAGGHIDCPYWDDIDGCLQDEERRLFRMGTKRQQDKPNKNMNQITITKVVSRNFIMDFVAKFQNMVGLNLTSYENMVQKGISQIEEELKQRQTKLKWFRYEISQLSNGAMAIMFYGEVE